MMQCNYPNLPLLEFHAKQALSMDAAFCKLWREAVKKGMYVYLQFDAIVFSQIWGSTCGGFDITKDGKPAIGGSAMTRAYTTVMHETTTDMYVVFFGEKPCYVVYDPTDDFFRDLQNHAMAPVSKASGRYNSSDAVASSNRYSTFS